MSDLTLKATAIGSLPHNNTQDAVDLIFAAFKDIPFVPQLVNVSRNEDMTIQYIQGLPGIEFDVEFEKFYYNSQSEEFLEKLEELFLDYEAIVNEKDFTNLGKYAISTSHSSAFDIFLNNLKTRHYDYAKCQIIGPFTWGTALCDRENICAFYDETYRDVLVKSLILKAVWQIEQIRAVASTTVPIVFIDEPVMSQLGTSAFMTVRPEEVVSALKEISDVIRDFGAISAVHCCGKADWSIVIESGVSVINFDAFAYTKSLGTYSREIIDFLVSGGYIAWGLVPTLDKDALTNTTVDGLLQKFESAVDDLVRKSKSRLTRDFVIKHSFLTPSCGAGGLSVDLSEKAMFLVNELSDKLKEKYEVF